jgi:hypothetical protein
MMDAHLETDIVADEIKKGVLEKQQRSSIVNNSNSSHEVEDVPHRSGSEVSRHSVDLGFEQEEASEIKSIGDFCKAIGRQFKVTQGLLVALMFVFTITFIFFPGVMDHTTLSFFKQYSWFSLAMFFVFNVSDTAGRYLGGTPCMATSRKSTIVGTGLRVLFFGTFLPIAYGSDP